MASNTSSSFKNMTLEASTMNIPQSDGASYINKAICQLFQRKIKNNDEISAIQLIPPALNASILRTTHAAILICCTSTARTRSKLLSPGMF